MRTKPHLFLAIGLICGLLLSLPAAAGKKTYEGLTELLKTIAKDPAVIAAVRAQNHQHQALTIDEIYQTDAQWVAETKVAGRPTIDALLHHPASLALRHHAEKAGVVEPLFVTDNRGLLVAASDLTYRFLMDETGLWQQAFVKRPGIVLTTPAAWHDAMNGDDERLWMSLGVRDPNTQDVIGVVSVEIKKPAEVKAVNGETPPPAPHAATIKTDPPAAPRGN